MLGDADANTIRFEMSNSFILFFSLQAIVKNIPIPAIRPMNLEEEEFEEEGEEDVEEEEEEEEEEVTPLETVVVHVEALVDQLLSSVVAGILSALAPQELVA